MNTVDLFYFSGSGNTKILAGLLAKQFTALKYGVGLFAIDEILKSGKPVEIEKFGMLGIIYPIHALNAPRIVFDFIKKLPASEGKKAFIVKGPADPYLEGGSTSMVRSGLTKKGYDVFYENFIVMPSNVLIRYDDELIKQLYNVAAEKAKIFAGEIGSGKRRLQKNGMLLSACSWTFSWLESVPGAMFFGKDLRVSKACNLCEKCIRDCPKGNILRKGDKIKFGWNCSFCTRCVYGCPKKAISPFFMKFMLLKDHYDFGKIIDNPAVRGNYLSEETRGWYKRFYEYVRKN